MLEAIAAAAALPVAQVRRAAMYSKSLGAVARAALLEGAEALGRFQLELFSPVAPMLAQTAADVGEALTELQGEVAFEWKMDGARIQVHKGADEVRIYTRALNDVDRKSTRLNSSHGYISYAVFCLKKKKQTQIICFYGFLPTPHPTLNITTEHPRPRRPSDAATLRVS